MNNLITTYAATCLLLFAQCGKNQDSSKKEEGKTERITYLESNEDFANPERGFYRYSQTTSSNYSVLNAATLKGYRNLQSISNANYQVYSTLVFRYFILDDVKNKDLTPTFLSNVQKDMDAAREAGVKLIPRFVYSVQQTAGNCPEGFICPPYGDAPKNIVLKHIASLKDVLHKNADVIACVQIGFIGTWGEQYYTDYFGDPSSNGSQRKLLDENWNDRNEILAALLDAVPDSRMVQIRYPQQKQRFIYGVNATINSAALKEEEAFKNTDKARLGFHNDCFMASSNDVGTFEDYGNTSSGRTSSANVVDVLKKYKMADSKYTVVGGETCRVFESISNCAPVGRAEEAFKEMHYSYINAHYNNEVNNKWQTDGCMDNIKKNLGYRFVLESATISKSAQVGGNISFNMSVINRGYASPYNKRPVYLVFRATNSQNFVKVLLDTDVRRWYSGAIKLETSVKLPTELKAGEYDVLLSMPDDYESISNRPEYSIRLANRDVWEANTGFNKLNHKITIN